MQHSSGIADYRHQNGFDVSQAYTPGQLIRTVAALPLGFAPGTDIQQSATNFLLLTAVVEKVVKMPYHVYIKKNQIDFLGLKQTFFGEDLAQIKQENISATGHIHQIFKKNKNYINPAETTTGYIEKDGYLVPVSDIHPDALKGFSDIWASAENVSHWDIALAGGVLIANPENRALLYQLGRLENGKVVPAMAGWQFYAHKGLMDIKGDIAGHSAFLSRFTDASELVCVTLLANKQGVELTNLARRIAAAFDPCKLTTGANESQLYMYESQWSVKETMDRVENNLEKMGIPVFAKFDHAQHAQQVHLHLLPNQVIVFGSPKVGTKLMQDNPSISIELPLKISVWEDKKGSIWVTFPQMKQMADRYGLENDPTIANMQSLLQKIVINSANIYQ